MPAVVFDRFPVPRVEDCGLQERQERGVAVMGLGGAAAAVQQKGPEGTRGVESASCRRPRAWHIHNKHAS